jgi:hypothetical protein
MTKEQIDSMSPEEKRKSIGTICGWTFHKCDLAPNGGGEVYESFWVRPGIDYQTLTAEDICWREGRSLPDYLNSLDAMHEARKSLTPDQQVEYTSNLYKVARSTIGSATEWAALVDATADMHATSFLMTMLP